MEGKRPRERPRFGMIDALKEGSYIKTKIRVARRCWMQDLPKGRELMIK